MIHLLGRDTLAVQGIVTRLVRQALAFVTVLGTAAGCVALHTPSVGPPARLRLTLLDTVVIATEPNPPGGRRDAWFGGLSGLARDARTGRYVAVIDDRQLSRVAWLDISVTAGRLLVRPGDVVPIHAGPDIDARLTTNADLESIVALPDGTWVVSEEGHDSDGEADQPQRGVWPPALLTLEPDFTVTQLQTWPPPFTLGPESGGVRDNQGFEGLTRTPDGRLIAGLERPLYSDLPAYLRNGRPFSSGRAGLSRLVELAEADGAWEPRRQWAYPISRTPAPKGFETICDDGEMGLTELLALDDVRLIALERACLVNLAMRTVRNAVQLYLVDVSRATDIAGRRGRDLTRARAASKTLLLDFDSLVPQLPPALANLDNFEALTFGPPLPGGQRTLIVVSDDNFRVTQKTAFVWLGIEEEAGIRN
jgi:3-phytase